MIDRDFTLYRAGDGNMERKFLRKVDWQRSTAKNMAQAVVRNGFKGKNV